MDEKGNYKANECPQGIYVTLKQLKELKFADTIWITEIKTPIVKYQVPKEVHDDPTSWEAFSNIFISPNRQILKNKP